MSAFAPSVRVDYSPMDKLRLVGAFRYEKNKVPDKAYPTWQLVANYKLQENSSVRAAYSRANRSPFTLDVLADATLVLNPYPVPFMHSGNPSDPSSYNSDPKNKFTVSLDGNSDLELATMDMIELGFRQKIGKHVLLNIEGFYSKLKNISALDVDTVKFTVSQSFIAPPSGMAYPYYRHQTYMNIKETSEQFGITAEIGAVVSKYVNFRLFGTYQHTNLKNHNNISVDEKSDILSNEINAAAPGSWSDEMVRTDIPAEYINTTSKATPSFYGGYELNWLPTDKWTFTTTGYGFTKQTYFHQHGSFDIKSKMLVNLRVAYKFTRNSSIFMSANNIFNATSQEFGFMDKTGATWYWGMNVKF